MIKQEYVKPGTRIRLVIPDPMPEVGGFTDEDWREAVRALHGRVLTIKAFDPNGPFVVVKGYKVKPSVDFVLVEEWEHGVPLAWLESISTPEPAPPRSDEGQGRAESFKVGDLVKKVTQERDEARSVRDRAMLECEKVIEDKYALRLSLDQARKERDEARKDFQDMTSACAQAISLRDQAQKQLALSEEKTLRQGLALSKLREPRPPRSLLERASARIGCEVSWLASVALSVAVLATWAPVAALVACLGLPVRGARAVGLFWRGQWERSWFGPHNGIRREFPWHERLIADPVRLAILSIPGLLLVALPSLVCYDFLVWSEQRRVDHMTVSAPPDPNSPKERALIEVRRARDAKRERWL